MPPPGRRDGRRAGERLTTDLVSSLANAQVDGQPLTPQEIGAFFVLLTVAGNDTTGRSTAHALTALTSHPDQLAWLLEDLMGRMPGAVEELVRWSTPMATFRRTATRDPELRGQQVTRSDRLVMIYSSANRDHRRIDHADQLDLSRDPNPHITFGGGGSHHCLGNHLARDQLKAIFTELLAQAPTIRTTAPPELTPSNLLKRLRCEPLPAG